MHNFIDPYVYKVSSSSILPGHICSVCVYALLLLAYGSGRQRNSIRNSAFDRQPATSKQCPCSSAFIFACLEAFYVWSLIGFPNAQPKDLRHGWMHPDNEVERVFIIGSSMEKGEETTWQGAGQMSEGYTLRLCLSNVAGCHVAHKY